MESTKRSKSRNQLRLARKAAEREHVGTIQYFEAQRAKQPRIRRWSRDRETGGLLVGALNFLARRQQNVARMRLAAQEKRAAR